MKKLKTKVFFVIFILLTTFTLVVFITSTTRSYMERKNNISSILSKVPREMNIMNNYNDTFSQEEETPRNIYLDYKVYTVFFDDYGNYIGAISNAYDADIEDIDIEKTIAELINKHKTKKYIGNLFLEKYSYNFPTDNILIIIDNTEINKELINQFAFNMIFFISCEIIILIITNLITQWIITPVKNSFEKQKIFIADASHELKTPLSVMVASADAYFNDKDEKWVRNMKDESERMIKLVIELLDLAKTEQEQDILMEHNNLSDIIEGSILTFESLFYENKVKLKYDIKPDIMMQCNETLIIELMSILIDNAIKHCSDKGKVIVNLYKKNKQITLEVKNTGLPIKKEEEEKIFERFYKTDSSRNRNSNNYGLGLAIAKNIVEKHNGEIKAHSNNGYTTFKVIWNQK